MEDDYKNDPEFQKLIVKYLDYVAGNVPDALSNLEKGDYKAVYKFGHNLKGTGAGYGFEQFTATGKEIMELAEAEDRDGLAAALNHFQQQLNEAKASLSSG